MKVHIGILFLTALLAGCSTSSEDLLPTNGHSIRDVWDKNAGSGQLHQYRSQDNRSIDPVDYISNREQSSYTRTAENEIDNLFPRLPNPNLLMYVYPHLSPSTEMMPIPGYSTVIPFYSRVQYAQPGERTRGL
ncbi:conjugative transfer region lipoprotein (TIGR03751 family) [Bisgaardia hudsonensis]|uniref:Conjugative transfer region lipoprotein (TIGR03751 family) n=1 Tax=Bisgaardia hudsonensis TaxID=109472 RepID=A0A4V2SJE0_9PAST|nr:TIGR03751 family conjugal transfer lipoprotein [Bisgaardia hudsonensis]QLB12787.1 conjugal transfer protein [Bisgaardia hudsonensis]TCP14340.1 conjugative transfer region lipoprotein (TIGR03751 family) [Bisgaardia hudsonensis]